MSQLIVALPQPPFLAEADQPLLHFMLLAEGEVVEAGHSLASALPHIKDPGHEVVALVPPQALSWHAVQLPPGVSASSPRLRAVLDGLLEDQLLDEAAALHLVLAGQAREGQALASADPTQWVAACERRWLAMAVQGLEEAGCKPTRVLPEWGPPGAARVHLTGTPEHLQMLLSSPHSATQLDFSPEMWAWAMQASDAQPTRLSAEPELLAHVQAQVQVHLQTAVQPWPRSERWAAAALPRWDLARGLRMRSRTQRSPLEWLKAPRWRGARWATLGVLAVNLVGFNALAWSHHVQLASRKEQMRQVLLQTYTPTHSSAANEPLAQMQGELERLRRATTAPATTDLPVMLGAVLSAVPAGRVPQALDYASGQLRLDGLALTPAELQAVASQLQSQAYSVQVQGPALSVKVLP
jgi:general secretion pathway protein L